MITCELCGRKIRSKRGLKIHMTKLHMEHNKPSLPYEKDTLRFFTLLEERKWSATKISLEKIEEMELDDEWLNGYTNALEGMMVSLRSKTSSVQPYISEVRKYDRGKLQDAKKFFEKASHRKISTRFDRGFFQAWHKYISYLIRKTKE